MEMIMKDLFHKYTGTVIKDYNKNLLEYPMFIEHLLYFILELEDNYDVPIISIINSMQFSEFTFANFLEHIAKKKEGGSCE